MQYCKSAILQYFFSVQVLTSSIYEYRLIGPQDICRLKILRKYKICRENWVCLLPVPVAHLICVCVYKHTRTFLCTYTHTQLVFSTNGITNIHIALSLSKLTEQNNKELSDFLNNFKWNRFLWDILSHLLWTKKSFPQLVIQTSDEMLLHFPVIPTCSLLSEML